MSWLVNRNVVIVIITLAVSFPLSLHRDIVKLSKSSGFGASPLQCTICLRRRPGLEDPLLQGVCCAVGQLGEVAPRETDV